LGGYGRPPATPDPAGRLRTGRQASAPGLAFRRAGTVIALLSWRIRGGWASSSPSGSTPPTRPGADRTGPWSPVPAWPARASMALTGGAA